MTVMPPRSCLHPDCTRQLIGASAWKRLDPHRRANLHRQGIHAHRGRGLCGRCYMKTWKSTGLDDFEASQRTRAEVLEEWHHFRALGVPLRRQVAELAPRLGMTFSALERALFRAGVRSEFADGVNRKDGCTA